jgi:DNA-binding response OmpR family regulator
MRVLVADTDSDVRGVIADLLTGPGFEVHLAADVQEARNALSSDGIDVFLCDLDLLRSNHDPLGRFAQSLAPRPYLVAMSASGNSAGSNEADRCLAKPFTRSQLLAAIHRGGDAARGPTSASPA